VKHSLSLFIYYLKNLCTCKRLINYVEKHRILSEHQFGFRKNRSTEHAILELTDKISKAIDEGKYTVDIFLDLSKAFDTVNHEILIKKLQHYGIRGIGLQWFINYLQERTEMVKYKQHRPTEMSVRTGVPQLEFNSWTTTISNIH
jgi:retron-type reverse transcriptase